jgi:glyoxylase-like metal-dependent hydrolase (beta-lactamase superfamily II)
MPVWFTRRWNLISSDMKTKISHLVAALALFGAAVVNAYADDIPDKLELTQASPNVYSAIGATQPPSYENHGHNNNLSVIITDAGVVVVNGGDNYLLAKALHASIQHLTDQPVVAVINENGQGHAILGNSYWRELGVPIYAHKDAVDVVEKNGEAILERMQDRNKEKAAGTFVAVPDHAVDDHLVLKVGSTTIEMISFGHAHSPGDMSVWLPEQKLIIAGDIAFHERLLAVFPDSETQAWIDSFNAMLELEPEIVIPGHGSPTNVDEITKYTRDYLQYLMDEVTKILENGDGLAEAYEIDQSAYSHLNTFEELAGKNAGRIFQELEFEFF